MFLNQNAKVARLSPNSINNDKEAYLDIMGNIPINVQPASPELTAVSDGVYGQTYEAYTTVSGIEIGDRITLSGTSKNFVVKGIRDWYYDPIPHLELILFAGDN